MATVFNNISDLNLEISKTNKEISDLQKQYSDTISLYNEYQRQYNEKMSENDTKNANIVLVRRNDADAQAKNLNTQIKIKQDYLNTLKENVVYFNENLSEADKAELKIEQTNAEASKASFMQGTTKYLIYGTIALVIVIGVIIVLRKKLAA